MKNVMVVCCLLFSLVINGSSYISIVPANQSKDQFEEEVMALHKRLPDAEKSIVIVEPRLGSCKRLDRSQVKQCNDVSSYHT